MTYEGEIGEALQSVVGRVKAANDHAIQTLDIGPFEGKSTARKERSKMQHAMMSSSYEEASGLRVGCVLT